MWPASAAAAPPVADVRVRSARGKRRGAAVKGAMMLAFPAGKLLSWSLPSGRKSAGVMVKYPMILLASPYSMLPGVDWRSATVLRASYRRAAICSSSDANSRVASYAYFVGNARVN